MIGLNVLLRATVMIALAICSVQVQAQSRKVVVGQWKEVFRIDEESGRMLLKPGLLASSGGAISLFDYGDLSVQTFSPRGDLLWKVGRRGGAPGEFQNATDIFVGAGGELMVLDPGNSRISRFSSDGKLMRVIPVDEQLLRIAATRENRIVAVPLTERMLMELTQEGRPARTLELPADMKVIPPLVRENTIHVTRSGYLCIVHAWSTRVMIIRLSDLSLVRSGELLNQKPFPDVVRTQRGKYLVSRVDPKAKRIVRSAGVMGDTLVVLDSRGEGGKTMLDFYEVPTLRYLFSQPAPNELGAFTIDNDLLSGLVDEPLPALVQWRWSKARQLP